MKPEQRFKAGGVEAAVWKNQSTKEGGQSEYYSVSFTRSYKDKAGAWKTTNSFGVSDLPKAVAVLGKAYEWCVMKHKEPDQILAV